MSACQVTATEINAIDDGCPHEISPPVKSALFALQLQATGSVPCRKIQGDGWTVFDGKLIRYLGSSSQLFLVEDYIGVKSQPDHVRVVHWHERWAIRAEYQWL